MKALLTLLFLLIAAAAPAAPVAVTSGEHEGFTRLVFDYGHPVDWRFGRTADGYELAIADAPPGYDLTGVFRLIGTSRLAAIWADPASGNLRVGIACACHAIPFEFRPGIIVVDLRDGPPPKGSSFETALAGPELPQLADKDVPRPRPRPAKVAPDYDWLHIARDETPSPQRPPVKPESRLDPLRDLLLEQLSRGAAQGVVEMTRPEKSRPPAPQPPFASAHVRIGDGPPLQSDPRASPMGDLGATGHPCIAAERLDVTAWASDAPVATTWAPAMTGLVGEFDRPDPAAQSRAVRYLLHLGFGAEARQMLDAFGSDLPDAALWRAMAHVLDDDKAGEELFGDQMACDGPAALWSMLAAPALRPGMLVNAAAVRLAFSALPLHLRQLLGPRLAEGFLAMGDTESARAIRDAVLRAGPDGEGGVARMEATLDARAGDPGQAEKRLRAAIDRGGPEALPALADLVELRARRGLPVAPDDVPALEAALAERAGTEDEARFAGALILAYAAAGKPEQAFGLLPKAPALEPEVWSLLARLGSDEQILRLGLPPSAAVKATADARQDMARRLLDLGLARPAREWLKAVSEPDPLLMARADLAVDEPREALRRIAGTDTPEGADLRAEALRALGDDRALAALERSRGDETAAAHTLARAADWTGLAQTPPSPWQSLAGTVAETAADETAGAPAQEGVLAAAHQLIDESNRTRAQIAEILSALPSS